MSTALKYGGITWSCSQDNGVFPAAEVSGTLNGEKRRVLELGSDPVLTLLGAWCKLVGIPKTSLVGFSLGAYLKDGEEEMSLARVTLSIGGKEWRGSGSNAGIGGALSLAFVEAINMFYEESEKAGELTPS